MTTEAVPPLPSPTKSLDIVLDWTVRENLALGSAVLQCGDQSWTAVSRMVRLFAEAHRTAQWCSPKNCAKQYALLLDASEQNRRRSEASHFGISQGELLVKRLTVERMEELQEAIRREQDTYRQIKEQIAEVMAGKMDDRIEDMWEDLKSQGAVDEVESAETEELKSVEDVLESPTGKSLRLKGDKRAMYYSTTTSTPDTRLMGPSVITIEDTFNSEVDADASTGTKHKGVVTKTPQRKPMLAGRPRPLRKAAEDAKRAFGGSSLDSSEKGASSSVSTEQWCVQAVQDSEETDEGEGRRIRNTRKSISRLILKKSPPKGRRSGESPRREASPGGSSDTSATTAMTMSSENLSESGKKGLDSDRPKEKSPKVKSPTKTGQRRSLRSQGGAEPVKEDQVSEVVSPRAAHRGGKARRQSVEADESPEEKAETREGADSCTDRSSQRHDSQATLAMSEEEEDEGTVKAWRKTLLFVLQTACSHRHSSLFAHPVSEEDAPGYADLVHRPMDLDTLKRRLDGGDIRSTAEFQRDLLLIFVNAVMYNRSDHPVHKMALEMATEVMGVVEEQCQAVEDPLFPPETKAKSPVHKSSDVPEKETKPSRRRSSATTDAHTTHKKLRKSLV